MNSELLAGLAMFAAVSSITPGPNNTMILASGVNFGLRRSMPHLVGISGGFGFMLLVIGLGLHTMLQSYPIILELLLYVGALYMLWLAYKLATAPPPDSAAATAAKPMGCWAAMAFQWVNPKAWIMAMTAMTVYVPADAPPWQVPLVAGAFTLVNIPCVISWAVFGTAMRSLLQNPVRLRIFNASMALALVASLYPMFFG